MPLYEYHCEACRLEFEEQVSFAKADEVECPGCGSRKVTRLASTFAACAVGGGDAPFAPACLTGG